jgi:NitT/TauT family transport system substrate-binding protein
MKTRNVYWIGLAAIAVLALSITAYFGSPPAVPTPTKLTVAVTRAPDSALVYIADNLGYFRDEGLDVTLQPHEFGKVALDSMLEDKADLATVAETPIMLALMRGKPLAVIAGIFSSDRNMGIVARRDSGITSPRDLVGKQIGAAPGTNGDYFRYAFLTAHGVPMNAVKAVSLRPIEMADALDARQVDAVAVWNPFLLLSERKLGSKGMTFFGESIYTYTFNLAGTKRVVTDEQQAVGAFLRALKKAERYARQNPDQSLEIVANATQFDRDMLKELWGGFSFKVSLDQTLLVGMENQAKWAIGEKLVERQTLPNFLDSIYFGGLEAVSPETVTMSH